MTEPRQSSLMRRMFSGITENIFHTALGVVDTNLVDYLSDLLIRFVRSEELYRVRDLRGRRLNEVADMLLEGVGRVGEAKRDVHRHIGDFTLFWTGVYPEALGRLQDKQRKDFFIDYCRQGKRAYHIAGDMSEGEPEKSRLFHRLGEDFEMCAYGLTEVRKEWERRDGQGGLIVG